MRRGSVVLVIAMWTAMARPMRDAAEVGGGAAPEPQQRIARHGLETDPFLLLSR